jgi:hypothetical protein
LDKGSQTPFTDIQEEKKVKAKNFLGVIGEMGTGRLGSMSLILTLSNRAHL